MRKALCSPGSQLFGPFRSSALPSGLSGCIAKCLEAEEATIPVRAARGASLSGGLGQGLGSTHRTMRVTSAAIVEVANAGT